MTATVCWRCGRERGRNMYSCEADASALGESACFAMAFARTERERDEARRELADAKAEVERLRGELSQLHEVLIPEPRFGDESAVDAAKRFRSEAIAKGELRRPITMMMLRKMSEHARRVKLFGFREANERAIDAGDAYELAAQWATMADGATAEADELRRLAWEWCIEATFWHRSWQAECDEIHAMLAAKDKRSALDAMADKAGPPPTAVLAQTEAPIGLRIPTHQVPAFALREPEPPIYIDPAHEPIESLGPVPVLARGVESLCKEPESLIDQVVGWLVRDAMRRGARLEDDR